MTWAFTTLPLTALQHWAWIVGREETQFSFTHLLHIKGKSNLHSLQFKGPSSAWVNLGGIFTLLHLIYPDLPGNPHFLCPIILLNIPLPLGKKKKAFWRCAPSFFLKERGTMSRTVSHPPPGINPPKVQAGLVLLPGTIQQCQLQTAASKFWLFGREQQQWHKSALFFLVIIIITIIASVKGGEFSAYCTSTCAS